MAVEELHISLSKPDFLRYLKIPIVMMSFWLLADKEAQPHTLIMIYRYLFIHLVAVKQEQECMLLLFLKTVV